MEIPVSLGLNDERLWHNARARHWEQDAKRCHAKALSVGAYRALCWALRERYAIEEAAKHREAARQCGKAVIAAGLEG